MRSGLLTSAMCVLIPLVAVAQPGWEKDYGGTGYDYGRSVHQTTDTGYVVAGYTSSFGNGCQVYLIKTDACGDTLWTRTYGGAGDDRGYSVQQTSDRGYIVAGYTSSFGNGYQVYLIKTDVSGDTLWTRTYGGNGDDRGCSVQQTADTGYVIAGYSNSFGNCCQVYLVRADSSGETLWTETYGGPGDDFGNSVEQTLDEGFAIAGELGISLTESWIYLIKTNDSGETLWSLTYRGAFSYSAGNSVQQTIDTGYIVSGESYDPLASEVTTYLIKTNAFGDTLWVGSPGGGSGQCVRQTLDGGYVMAGTTYRGMPRPIACLAKTNASGDELWHREYGGPPDRYLFSVQQTTDTGYVAAGVTSSSGDGWQVYLVKTGEDGRVEVEETPNAGVRTTNAATVVRGVLWLAPASSPKPQASSLLDAAGRQVLDLRPGPNDVRHLVPGVYFARRATGEGRVANSKVIVTR